MGIPNDKRLDGWKAIANFLGRERSTAIRWANERGLPVHRVPGGRTGTVYAIESELDAWLSSESKDKPPPVAPPPAAPLGAAAVETVRAPRDAGRLALVAGAVAAAAIVALLIVTTWRATPSADAPVSIAAVASTTASRETAEFAHGLNADLARFAMASPGLAIFEREPGTVPESQYAVRAEIEHADGRMTANARLIAVRQGQVLWSRRFEQSGPALSALRERVAANIVDLLRCSFGGLGDELPKARLADIAQILSACQSMKEGDMSLALTRARQLTRTRPDMALGWAMLAVIQGEMIEEGDTGLKDAAVANSRRAAAIAPDNVSTWIALASANGDGPTSPRALPVIDAALRTHPDHPWLLHSRSVIRFNLGYVKDSAEDSVDAIRYDPSSLSGRDIAVRRLASAGRIAEALRLQTDNERLWPGHPYVVANRALIGNGEIRKDADIAAIEEAKRVVVDAPNRAYFLARLYERNGDHAAALEWLARAPTRDAQVQWSTLFWPDAAGLRAEPAFFRKMFDLGLLNWWLARRKWPDFCSEPGLKYDCATEARRLRLQG